MDQVRSLRSHPLQMYITVRHFIIMSLLATPGSPSSGSPSNFHLTRLPPGVFPSGLPEVTDVKPAVTKEEEEKKKLEEEKRRKKELSDEERQKIMMSDDFQKFFDNSSRLVERALYEDINVFVDYTGVGEDAEGFEDKAGVNVTFNRIFYDERWTRNRVITSMDWSSVFPELLVASYDKNPDSAADPDGICLVWNTRFKKSTPENVFHCQSQVCHNFTLLVASFSFTLSSSSSLRYF